MVENLVLVKVVNKLAKVVCFLNTLLSYVTFSLSCIALCGNIVITKLE